MSPKKKPNKKKEKPVVVPPISEEKVENSFEAQEAETFQ